MPPRRNARGTDHSSTQRALEADGAAAVLAFLLEHTGAADDLVIVQAAYMNVDQRDTVRRFADVIFFDGSGNTNENHMQLGSLAGVTGNLRPYDGCTVLMSGESKLSVRFAHRSLQFFTSDRKRGVSYVGHNRVIMSDGSFVILKAHSQLAMETFPWSYGAEQRRQHESIFVAHPRRASSVEPCVDAWTNGRAESLFKQLRRVHLRYVEARA